MDVYIVAPKDTKAIELSDGRLFKKQLVPFGDWVDPLDPSGRMVFDMDKFRVMVRNFKNKVLDRVPVPAMHTNDPMHNKGEVLDLFVEGDGSDPNDGLYGVLDIKKPDAIDGISDETIFNNSIAFDDDYVDTKTGEHYGWTLRHVALVNNPYIKAMKGFVALSDTFGSEARIHELSENVNEETKMSQIKNDKAFPVEVTYAKDGKDVTETIEPGAVLEVPEGAAEAVQKTVADAVEPEQKETDAEKAAREAKVAEDNAAADKVAADEAAAKAEADKNLSEADKLRRQLDDANAKLRANEIDKQYDDYLKEGKVLPAQETEFRQLAEAVHGQSRELSDGKSQNLSDLLTAFIAKSPKHVALDDEKGATGEDDPAKNLDANTKKGLQAFKISPKEFADSPMKDGHVSVGALISNKKEN